MDINSDINILGGVSDYNLIRVCIAGEAKDKSSDEIQREYTTIKTEKAFNQLAFKSAELADNTIYYARRKKRDDEARNAFFAELEKEDASGIYMRDIIREEMTSDDVLLR